MLALRAVKGLLLARDLAIATAQEARGAARSTRGLVFRGDCTLDVLLARIDEKGLRWSRRTGASPQFDVSGTVDGRELRMRLVDRADVGGPAASVPAGDLDGVLPYLAAHLHASVEEPALAEGASRVAWLRSVLIADRPPEEAIARGLSAGSAEVRRSALEAAWLAMSPGILDVLREREGVEPDGALRALVGTTVALLAPAPPDEPATATAMRKASLLHARQRREGLEELAARELSGEAAATARELLTEVARGADDRDARFLAGLLAWLRC